MSDRPSQVVFPLFGGMTALDFVAPYQVFSAVVRRASPSLHWEAATAAEEAARRLQAE